MSVEWEAIVQGLAAYLTTQLQGAYSADSFATCDLNTQDFQSLDPGYTPAIAIWQQGRTRLDTNVPTFHRRVKLIGVIRRLGASADNMQTDGNGLERNLDAWMEDPLELGGYRVSIFQDSGQASTVYGGADECWVEYDATVRYSEAL